MIQVALASRASVYCDGLAALLPERAAVRVVGKALNARQALRLVREQAPDVLVLDLSLPGAAGVIQTLHREGSGVRLVGFGAGRSSPAGRYGLDEPSCVPADAPLEWLLRAIERRGWLAPVAPPPRPVPRRLTPRERQVAELVELGLGNPEIGRRLGIRVSTVKQHVHQLLGKLGLRRRAQIAAHMRNGAGSPPSRYWPGESGLGK